MTCAVNTVLKEKKLKAFLKLWDKTRAPTLSICVQHTTGSPVTAIRQEETRMQVGGRKEAKLSHMQRT